MCHFLFHAHKHLTHSPLVNLWYKLNRHTHPPSLVYKCFVIFIYGTFDAIFYLVNGSDLFQLHIDWFLKGCSSAR